MTDSEEADLESPSSPTQEDGSAQTTEPELSEPVSEKHKAVLEALLYISEHPLTLDRLVSILEDCPRSEVRRLVDALNSEYLERGRAFEIVDVAGGYQVRTRPQFAGWIAKLQPQRPQRLSRAALESLAMIAYRQPVTRAEVESIRGVDTGAVIGSLLEKKLVRILGRREVAGRPILYGTTPEFLEIFGLKNLASLPTLKEIETMLQKDEITPETEAESREEGQREEAGEADEGVPVMTRVVVAEEDRATEGLREAEGPALAEHGEGEDWEEEGDLETVEMDALLRAVKTKVLTYDEVVAQAAPGGEGIEGGEDPAGSVSIPGDGEKES